jgi:hypothetical protein
VVFQSASQERGGNSLVDAAVAGHLHFHRSTGFGNIFFSFYLFFLVGLLVPRPQQFVVSCGCYINIAGRNSVSSTVALEYLVILCLKCYHDTSL